MDKLSGIVNLIKQYCEKREEVLMGFLFGSYASNYQCKESDVDIALYLRDTGGWAEIEIQNDIERLLHKQVDLVVLSRAPATLAWNILRKGIPLIIKDRGFYLDFLLDVSNEAQDFIDFNLDTWRRKYEPRASR